MKILNTTSKTFEGNNLDYYDFDKNSNVDYYQKKLDDIQSFLAGGEA